MRSSKMIKSATLKVYEGAPHGMCTTHKDQVNADLLAFLKSWKGSAARSEQEQEPREDHLGSSSRGRANGTQPGTPGPTWQPTPGPDCRGSQGVG